jgi:S-(hydroxymethyl)glutathione dehydrogenase / alcohol dehydrogenase
MKDTFKAAVLTRLNQPLEIMELHQLSPIDGQVKVKMVTTGLCGAQVNEMTGKKGEDKYLPHFMGHEGYGEVVEVGPEVSKVSPGDYVIVHWREAEGESMAGIKYSSSNNLTVGAGPCTTFAEYTVVAENRCTKISKNDSIKNVLPLLGCAISTSYGAVTKEAKVTEEDSVLIFGAGGLGMALMFWCNILGYRHVDVIDIHPDKEKQVKEFGGNFLLAEEINYETKYDKIFETTGVVQNIENTLSLANKGAKIILIGQPRIGSDVTFKNFLKIYDDIKYIPSMGGQFDPDVDMSIIYKLCEENAELANKLVSKVICLDEINQGFLDMKSPTARRIIVGFSGEENE